MPSILPGIRSGVKAWHHFFKTDVLSPSLAKLPNYYQKFFKDARKCETLLNKHPILLDFDVASRFLSKMRPSDIVDKVVFDVNGGIGLLSYCASQLHQEPDVSSSFSKEFRDSFHRLRAWVLVEKYHFLKLHLNRHQSHLSPKFPFHFLYQDHMNPVFYDILEREFQKLGSDSTPAPSVTLITTYGEKFAKLHLIHDFKLMTSKSGIFKPKDVSFYSMIPSKITADLQALPGSKNRHRASVLTQVVSQIEVLDSTEMFAPFNLSMDFLRIQPSSATSYKGEIFEFDAILTILFMKPKQSLRDGLRLLDPTSYLISNVPAKLLHSAVYKLTNEEICQVIQVVSDWPQKHHFLSSFLGLVFDSAFKDIKKTMIPDIVKILVSNYMEFLTSFV